MQTEAPPAEESERRTNTEEETENLNIPEDFYERLGVDQNASDEQIRTAYRIKIKTYHPDANPDNLKASEEWSSRINESWEALSNPDKRRAYDVKREKKRVEDERKKQEEEKTKEKERKEKEATLGNLRQEANDAERESGKDGREYDPNHPNPFWREQEELRTPFDKFTSGFADKFTETGKGASRKAKDFFKSIFRENPRSSQETMDEYEGMVASGRAERINELKGLSFADYMRLKKTHEKTGNFKNYFFRSIGVYDTEGNFTGTVRSYRIMKNNGR